MTMPKKKRKKTTVVTNDDRYGDVWASMVDLLESARRARKKHCAADGPYGK